MSIILEKTWVQGRMVEVDNLLGTAFTGESGSHTFRISGIDANQTAVPITGTITGTFLAANNATVPLTGSLSDGVAILTLSDLCYDVPGRFILTIYATSGGATTCIYGAVGNVLRTDSQQIAYPTAAVPDVEDLIEQAQQIIEDASSIVLMIADDTNGMIVTLPQVTT